MTRNTLGLAILLFVLGTLAEIIGYMLMIMHWPGSKLIRITGLLFFIPGFFLLAVYISNRKKREKRKDDERWEK